jgi:ubiquitin-conjugating enzyme E2 D/E
MSEGRILSEIKEIYNDPPDYITAGPIDDNDITHWEATINGPEDSAYKNGIFILDIKIPKEYPYKPPICKFKTKILHPNINENSGSICLNILKHDWNPTMTISNVLVSIVALLYTPNFNNPYNGAAIKLHNKNDNDTEYKKTIQEWVKKYSGGEQIEV